MNLELLQPSEIEEDWQKIRQRITFTKEKEQSLFLFMMKIAAAMIIVFGVSFGFWQYWNVPGQGRWIVYETGITTDSIVLPDESIVFLNRNSSLKFKNAFLGNERRVALTGEGYFEIKEDLKKPFSVEMGMVTIKVLGTAFNVDGTREDGAVELNVTQGKVLMKSNFEKTILKEGEWAVMGKKLIDRGIIKDPNFISWKTGKLEFNNSTLENVIQILTKHFQEIKTATVDSSCNILITTRFTDCSLQDILEELSVHFEKKIVLHHGKLIISD